MRDDLNSQASAMPATTRAAANPQALEGTMSDHYSDRIDEDGHKSRDAIDERGTVVRR
jgi:hypothetical protein